MAGLSYKNKYERYSLTNYKIRYFKRYDVAEDLKKALKTYFGFSKFKVGQESDFGGPSKLLKTDTSRRNFYWNRLLRNPIASPGSGKGRLLS